MPGYTPPEESFPVGFLLQVNFPSDGPPGILADAIDPRTGEFLSISRGFDPTDAAVLLALSVERRSGASVEDTGHRLFDIEHVDERAAGFLEQEVSQATKRLRDGGQIRPNRTSVILGSDEAEIRFEYVNSARRQVRTAVVPAQSTRFRP